ncbi:MAG: hypothetical protein GF335_01895 [Candidatus Moranbacteria bacterium]|nr:hypothetical protein [Candidatus Moranbacteria bacterium]
MPKVKVGGVEMNYLEHQEMLKEMEKAQKPFKDFIYGDLLLAYEIFLKDSFDHDTFKKHFGF